MPTKLIMIRHGYSKSNKAFRFTGHLNIGLDERGDAQAEKLGEYFKNHKIDNLYSSDLIRAYDTAKPISKATGLPIIADKRLREINGGEWEGKSFDELEKEYPDEYSVWINDIGRAVCPCGESMKELSNRILNTVKELCGENDSHTICIVTHGVAIRAVCTVAENLPFENMTEVPYVDNASISTFEYDNGKITKETINYTEHLGQLYVKQQGNV